MKVAFVSQYFDLVRPPDQSSIGIWTYEVARRMGSGCATTVIARRPRGMPAYLDIDGTRMEFLACAPLRVWATASRLWTRAWPRATPLFSRNFYALDYLFQVTQRLRRLAPDVVHLQNFPHYAPAIRRAAPDAAIILHMHCDWLAELDHNLMSRSIAATDLVTGCSTHIVSAARKRFANTDVRFSVLPNGAPVERIANVAARPTPGKVLFVGRISPEKGVHTLLEAWPRVIAARPDARLDIVGPHAVTPREFLVDLSDDPDVLDLSRFYQNGNASRSSYNAALRAMISPQLAHTVTFIGHEPHERVMERYAASSLLVNPSLSESFGMSLVEALATGTPVIATRAGGMPEIIEATEGGVVVEKNSPAALANAIIRLLNDPERSAKLGRFGAQRVAKLYPWTRIAALTREVHNEALSIRQQKSASAH